ncbi:helix-turn-helix transcriptional regulator [Tsukamurella tyrosinosolvens]|uniref:helix-turn-helix transcriptional regulator n=1 Tax=Tsukamurella tyrosinosolvens TaxID=57704 RepID=UPI00079AF425|nr:helix-turn-helix transcriptional regulator [Tsukamurella tyrosinosolvens]KXP02874.1 hypothetical protein AXK59_20585 [Tsukamurella tyrosinosolvens]KZL97073.1 hypothetical protein AXX05_16545 [Tsukamurella tyrosinosolvens]
MSSYEDWANERVGKSLQNLRAVAELTQGDLAKKLTDYGVPIAQQTIAKIENGTRPLKYAEALAITQVMDDVSLNDLMMHAGLKYDANHEAVDRLKKLEAALDRLKAAAKETQNELIASASFLRDDGEFVSARNRTMLDILTRKELVDTTVRDGINEVNLEWYAQLRPTDYDDWMGRVVARPTSWYENGKLVEADDADT